jgi:hypothetical protein
LVCILMLKKKILVKIIVSGLAEQLNNCLLYYEPAKPP